MQRLLPSLPLAVLLAACSPTPPAETPTQQPPEPQAAAPAQATAQDQMPATPSPGSATWYMWVDRTLHISHDGHGPDYGSGEWNNAVQYKLGDKAPSAALGSPEWQQAVDSILRAQATSSP